MTVNPVIFFFMLNIFLMKISFAFYFSADAARMKMHYIIPFRPFWKMHDSLSAQLVEIQSSQPF